MTTNPKQKRGRPPSGAEGQRVRDYPAMIIRMPPQIHEMVSAVAEAKNWSRSHVLREAIVVYRLNYLRTNEPRVSAKVDKLLEARRRPTAAPSRQNESSPE